MSLFLAQLANPVVAEISLTREQAMHIGHKVWQNESGGMIAGLTAWNNGEDFASLGIGHFIWYPEGKPGPFEESFPPFLHFAETHGASLPSFLQDHIYRHCPWNSRAEFIKDESTPQMSELRQFLTRTIDFQVGFLIERMQQALPKMLGSVPTGEHERVTRQYQRLAASPQGCYALIDYVNFKGEGVLLSERYRGRGWGLLQVLEGMPERATNRTAPSDFAEAAGRVLRERVNNSPSERNERRWLPGWLNRVATYR